MASISPLAYAQTTQQIIAACKQYGVGTPEYVNCASRLRAQYAAGQGDASSSAATSQETADGCGLTNLTQCLKDLVYLAPGWLAIIVLQLSHLLVWLAGGILNYIIKYSVLDFKDNIDGAGAIIGAWKVVRDITNMGFIFILLYAAIRTILGNNSENKRLVVNIVVVAAVINFSFFLTRIVIDIANVLAITFYDAIAPNALAGTNSGIADSLMSALYITSIWETTGILQGERMFIIGVMGTLLSLVAAFVFFAMAFMFIIRFVILIFVLILSPIAFIAYTLPKGQAGSTINKYADQWRSALFGQAFFAPVFFFMMWIVIKISRSLISVNGSLIDAVAGVTDASGVNRPVPLSNLSVLVNFVLVIALMIIAMMLAKDWAGKSGPGMGKLLGYAASSAGGATFGMAARLGRGTVGRVGAMVGDSKILKGAMEAGGAGGVAARLAMAAGRKTKLARLGID